MSRALSLAIFILLSASGVRGQIINLQGGDSTLFNAVGGSAVLYFPGSELSAGLGLYDGKLVASAADQFSFRGWDIRSGDSTVSFTTEGAGLGLSERGIFVQKIGKKSSVAIFMGACGSQFGSPFFLGLRATKYCLGYSYKRMLLPSLTMGSFAVSEGKNSAIESLHWTKSFLVLSAAAGVLNDDPFLNFSATASRPWGSFNAQRQTVIFQTQTINVTSVSAGTRAGFFSVHAADFISNHSGYNAGVGETFSIFTLRQDYYKTTGSSGIISTGLSARISRRFTFTGSSNDDQGKWSASYGGTYTSNLVSLNINHSLSYAALRGFVQTTSASITLQLPHSSTASLSTVQMPDGSMRWTSYGGSFFQGPLQGAALPSIGRSSSKPGKYVVNGLVLDERGSPVEGAAVMIGQELAIADSEGKFFVRMKYTKPVAISVDLAEFAAPGKWEVVSCPASAVPGTDAAEAIQIRLKRKS